MPSDEPTLSVDDAAAQPSSTGPAPAAPQTMTVGQPYRVPVEQLVAFMFRATVIRAWLGPEASVALTPDGRCMLPHADGRPRRCRVRTLRRGPEGLDMVLHDATTKDSERTIALRVRPRSAGRHCTLTVSAAHLDDEREARATLQLWQDAMGRLRTLVDDRTRNRDRSRQAVIVVHGIGEQLPGQTLRSFVDGLLPDGTANVWVKPDRTSSLFELRKVTVEGNRDQQLPTTDIYELYWAHLIRDTTAAQVLAWSLGLLFSRRPRVPESLLPHLWVLRSLVVLAAAGIAASAIGGASLLPAALVAMLVPVAAIAGLCWRLFQQRVLVDLVGDAARYLQPKPDNIARRQAIREAGVDLIEALHDSGRYDRIVLFGHSLGSVIAYDILTFAWIRLGLAQVPQSETQSSSLLRLEASMQRPTPEAADVSPQGVSAQSLQHDAWLEYRRNGFRWLISDFVTAGSPLTHAKLLLSLDTSTSFDDLTRERVFPSCPPVPEPGDGGSPGIRFTYEKSYRDPATGRQRSVVVPHHAAPFALTRWTNLYFPFSGVLRGDPIGGPLAPVFGGWVADDPLEHPGTGAMGFAHTAYWARGRTTEAADPREEPHHLERLRAAIRLNVASELTALRQSLPLARTGE